jgi:hypothetical protein
VLEKYKSESNKEYRFLISVNFFLDVSTVSNSQEEAVNLNKMITEDHQV